jgi:hypothetical protein
VRVWLRDTNTRISVLFITEDPGRCLSSINGCVMHRSIEEATTHELASNTVLSVKQSSDA